MTSEAQPSEITYRSVYAKDLLPGDLFRRLSSVGQRSNIIWLTLRAEPCEPNPNQNFITVALDPKTGEKITWYNRYIEVYVLQLDDNA